jgi:phosphomannomutase/phosphoglucomutase
MEGAVPGLEQLLPGAAGHQEIPSGVDPLSKGLDGEDITRFDVFGETPDSEHPTVPEGVGDASGSPEAAEFVDLTEVATDAMRAVVPASIFRSYDIRGVVGDTLTDDGTYQIGRALGAEAEALGQQTVVVARDGRSSSPMLKEALVTGLQESGRDVLDIGLTPTPVLYFATHYLDTHSGVMVTGSHNPPEYNGLKIVLDGQTLSGDAIQSLRARIEKQDFTSGQGTLQTTEIVPDYIRRISEEIPVTLGDALKVVVDCGNAVPGIVAPHILRAIGHDIVELYCDVDPGFPHHHPDPSQPENLADLIDMVLEEEADLGLAFDGDGDRLGVVDSAGNIVWPDQQMMLFAQDVLARNPGAKIIYDVKCSRRLAEVIRENGGEPIMWRTGHSLIKTKMQETGALLAGEMSGHIFFKERWYGFDDALYSAARLLDILVSAAQSPDEVFAALPGATATPELRLDMAETRHAEFMQQIMSAADFDNGEVTTIDGLRVDFPNGWGLVRPSNTTPCLVLRFEGDDETALEDVKGRFRELLLKIDSSLDLPF